MLFCNDYTGKTNYYGPGNKLLMRRKHNTIQHMLQYKYTTAKLTSRIQKIEVKIITMYDMVTCRDIVTKY